tara:strand:- start:7666 stop:7866 length:201 start_codon:yes stop_codon:yes gene_type:complete
MLTIGENEYKIEDLDLEVQNMVNRAKVLSEEANQLQLRLNEVAALGKMYQNAIVLAVEPEEDDSKE